MVGVGECADSGWQPLVAPVSGGIFLRHGERVAPDLEAQLQQNVSLLSWIPVQNTANPRRS